MKLSDYELDIFSSLAATHYDIFTEQEAKRLHEIAIEADRIRKAAIERAYKK